MNVSELSRKIRINTKELLEILPEFGFDVGKKAIKFDTKIARKIIEMGEELREKIEANKQAKLEEFKKLNEGTTVVQEITEAQIPSVVTVRDFSTILNRPVNEVIKELMKNGVLASLNERIDFETAAIVADEFGVKLSLTDEIADTPKRSLKIKQIIEDEAKSDLQARAPVIVVMGHVDHGKTKLLDAIRKTDVVAGEAGGITQHIGAYQVHKKDTLITFIDTPGHEAFTAMRSRGAKIADVAILVVAANDSIKPQTVEAIKIIQQSEIPMVVAINKIDLPEANIEKVKQDLASMNLNPEDWGGDTITVSISAKENQNIDDLLDTILLVAELEKDKIVANPNKEAVGTIIESHIDKGEGPVATVLVQNGTLKKGDNLTINGEFFGKARSLKDYTNKDISEASPSVPVKIIGLKYAPKVGDIVEVTQKIERKHKKTKGFQIQKDDTVVSSVSQVQNEDEESKVTKVNLIIKADVLGSLEAICESLEKIESEEIKVKIISKGLGNITDADVDLALSGDALLLGFHVKPIPSAEDLAREKSLDIKYYDIIYKLIEDVKEEMSKQLSPEIIREDLGKLKVLAIFKTEPKNVVLGGKVTQGKVINNGKVEVLRNKEIVAKGEIVQLQSGKQDVNEVQVDQECGISLAIKKEIKEGDVLQVYQEQSLTKKL
jgi:translation initiation factor IF-2